MLRAPALVSYLMEKKVDWKSMQVNVLKNVTRMTKRDEGIRTYYIARHYLNVLGTEPGYIGWTRDFKTGLLVRLSYH